jgi:hypothetical protein
MIANLKQIRGLLPRALIFRPAEIESDVVESSVVDPLQ